MGTLEKERNVRFAVAFVSDFGKIDLHFTRAESPGIAGPEPRRRAEVA
jgi:hypothetical protein